MVLKKVSKLNLKWFLSIENLSSPFSHKLKTGLLQNYENKDAPKFYGPLVYFLHSLLKSFLLNQSLAFLNILTSTESRRKNNRLFHFFYHILSCFSSKRGSSIDHLKQQNSKSPNINFVVIWFFLNHFRCHILIGTT